MNCACGHSQDQHHAGGACLQYVNITTERGRRHGFQFCDCNHYSPLPDVTITHDEDGMPTRMEFHDEH